MAKIIIWSEDQKKQWAVWLERRPQVVKDVINKYNLCPDTLYRLKPTGQKVTLYSVSEDGTVTVTVTEELNRDIMLPFGGLLDSRVFGIDPADLEECDLPEGVVAKTIE